MKKINKFKNNKYIVIIVIIINVIIDVIIVILELIN